MRITSVIAGAVFAVSASACAGTVVDGYDAAYVEVPPGDIDDYPRYPFRDGYVYEVRGRYYHDHHGRWVEYWRAPVEIRGRRPETPERRGRAEHQR